MKNTTKTITKRLAAALVVLSSATSFAGEPMPMPMEPAPAPSLWSWFAGGSVGQMDEFDDEAYYGHIGMEKHSGVNSHAFYLEVGYFEFDETFNVPTTGGGGVDVDIDFIPVTLNYKFERPFLGMNSINWYAGLGAGALFIDGDSDDDTVFMAQGSLGLVWNLSDRFEIFGGGRWQYFDLDELDEDDDILGELGLRFNF